MAGLIWQVLGPDACAWGLQWLLAASSPAAWPRGRWRGLQLPFPSSSVCPGPLAAGTELSSSGSSQCPRLYLIPGTPLRVLPRHLCLQKASSGASSSQHDHSMTGALLGVWKPRGSILPN